VSGQTARDRLPAVGVAVLAAAPFVWVVLHVARHTVNVPVHDQWQVQVPIAIRAAAGTLRFGDLLAQYLEHRYLVTRGLTAINAWLFGWDLRLEAWINVGLALVTLVLLADLVRRQRSAAPALGMALCAVLLFSARQRWTWGLLSSFLSVVLSLTLALWTLTRGTPSWPRLGTAAGLAALATWSAGPGVAVWPAVGVTAWLVGYRRPVHAVLWIGAAGAAVAAFLIGYERRPMAGATAAETTRYVLAFLGGPLSPESASFVPVATALGALGLAGVMINLWVIWSEPGKGARAAPWLGLCLFSVGAAALAALARASLLNTEPWQPLRARYVSLSTPFWAGLVGLTLLAIPARDRPRHRRAAVVAGSALLGALALSYVVANVAAARAPVLPTPAHEQCLTAFPQSRDASCLADVVYGVRAIQPRIDDLARHHLAAFRRPAGRRRRAATRITTGHRRWPARSRGRARTNPAGKRASCGACPSAPARPGTRDWRPAGRPARPSIAAHSWPQTPWENPQ
jgi:hypothetical protein